MVGHLGSKKGLSLCSLKSGRWFDNAPPCSYSAPALMHEILASVQSRTARVPVQMLRSFGSCKSGHGILSFRVHSSVDFWLRSDFY
jgi:hypothetical protein